MISSQLLLIFVSIAMGQEIVHQLSPACEQKGDNALDCTITFDQEGYVELSNKKINLAKVNLDGEDYKMTLVLEHMNCDPAKNSWLSIQGDHLNHTWCTTVDYRSTDFSKTKFVAESAKTFVVELHGSDDVSASITITAFKETKSGEKCGSKEEFYCGSKNSMGRCISKNLFCDNHANCGGMTYNEDERCCDGVYLYGVSCDWFQWSYIWAALFALVFVTVVPAVTVFILCFYRKRGPRRRDNCGHEEAVRELANDHPPSYNDVQDTNTPPPCFCSALNMTKSAETRDGVLNSSNRECTCQSSNGN